MRLLRFVAFALVAIVVVGTVSTMAYSSGPKKGGVNPATQGCNCHGDGQKSEGTVITFGGVPETYEAGKAYDLAISSVNSQLQTVASPVNHGGFHLSVTGGVLAARGTTDASWVQTATNPTSIEHTAQGERNNLPSGGVQTWEIKWTAPTKGDVTFKLWVNRVNGDGSNDAADKWNTVEKTSKGPSGGGSPGFEAGFLVAALAAAGLVVGVLRRREA